MNYLITTEENTYNVFYHIEMISGGFWRISLLDFNGNREIWSKIVSNKMFGAMLKYPELHFEPRKFAPYPDLL